MPVDDKDRQRDPLADAQTDEPSQEIPEYLRRHGRGQERQTPIRPSERKRKERMLTVTFSEPEIVDRIRELAFRWGWYAPDRKHPAVSDVVEWLLLPRLEAAEEGKVNPAERP
jgi:hypothetical protein